MQNKSKKKLLYIMGIDWDWIFQRPQIIEQHLEESYDVTVIFPRSILKWRPGRRKLHSTALPSHFKILWTLPFQEKNPAIGWLARKLFSSVFRYSNRFDVIVIGYPLYYRYIPASYQGKLVYDCMDYHKALYPDPKSLPRLLEQEDALASRCNLLIVSSEKLALEMQVKVTASERIKLIRNGVSLQHVYAGDLQSSDENGGSNVKRHHKPPYKLGYFGTIAEWLDYNLLLKSLSNRLDIEYHLIGPVRASAPVTHERLIMEGVAQHDRLFSYVEDYACLVMPFLVNDVVEWVDPVKLYEYIAMGKCIISVRYPEIERFEPYVYMYSTAEEYLNLLDQLITEGFPPKYDIAMQQLFLSENSWQFRFKQLDQAFEDIGITES